MNVDEAIQKARDDFSARVNQLMEAKGTNTHALAKLARLHHTSVYRALNVRRGNPKLETMVRIAHALGADAVVGGDDADKWQPIETAPRDGTEVSLRVKAKWYPLSERWSNVDGLPAQPTHWQPVTATEGNES